MSDHSMLYRFFDAKGTLLYVGISSVGPSRWKEHSKNRPWWHETASATIEHFETRSAALRAEQEAVKTESPRHNVHHNRRKSVAARRGQAIGERTDHAVWRRSVMDGIKKLNAQRFEIEPIEWRGSTVHALGKVTTNEYDNRRPFIGFDPVGNRNSAWTFISLDYPSFSKYKGIEIGPELDKWRTLWAYVTKQESFFYHPKLANSQYLYITCPTAFDDVFFKVLLAAEQGQRHWALDLIESALDSAGSEVKHYNELAGTPTWIEARDDALVIYSNAHRRLAKALGRVHAV